MIIIALAFALRRSPVPELHERRSLFSLINVHGLTKRDLIVCGRTFANVKGGPPYYINVTNTSYLLFAYEPSPDAKALVLCDTNDCTFKEAQCPEDLVFGNDIGYWAATKGRVGDYVESAVSNRLFLLSSDPHYTERSVWDTSKGIIRILDVQSERGLVHLNIETNR
jgi:hypothetical protein